MDDPAARQPRLGLQQGRHFGFPRPARHGVHLLILLMLGVSLLLASDSGPRPVLAQGFAVRFTGVLTLGGAQAPAGTRVTVYQGLALADVVECGTGTVAGGGVYSVEVAARPFCATTRTTPCCNYTFVAHDLPGQPGVRMTVGACACGTYDLDRPISLNRTREGFPLAGTRLPGSPEGGPNPIVPAHWFYGTLTLAGQPAPVGTAIRVGQGRGGVTTDCGSGRVTAAGGQYALAVDAREGCATSDGVSCCNYVFAVGDEIVGACSCGNNDLRKLSTVGGQTRLPLSGRQPPPVSAPSPTPPPLTGGVATTVPAPTATPLPGGLSTAGCGSSAGDASEAIALAPGIVVPCPVSCRLGLPAVGGAKTTAQPRACPFGVPLVPRPVSPTTGQTSGSASTGGVVVITGGTGRPAQAQPSVSRARRRTRGGCRFSGPAGLIFLTPDVLFTLEQYTPDGQFLTSGSSEPVREQFFTNDPTTIESYAQVAALNLERAIGVGEDRRTPTTCIYVEVLNSEVGIFHLVRPTLGDPDPAGCTSGRAGCGEPPPFGPYTNLADLTVLIEPGRDFSESQRLALLAENRKRNNGTLLSDGDGLPLNTGDPDRNAVIDHICPAAENGPNANYNACVLSRQENLAKSDRPPYTCG